MIHKTVHAVVVEHGGAKLEKGRARLHKSHADGLGGGVSGPGDDGSAGGKARFPGCLGRHRPHHPGGHRGLGDLIRAAVQSAGLLIHRPVRPVQRPEGSLGQELVDDIFSGELCRQIGAAREKFAGFFIYLRLMPLDPQDFCGRVTGTDGVAEQLLHLFGAVVVREPPDLLPGSGVDAIQDGRPQGAAVPVHREAVRSQGADTDAGDLLRPDPGGFQQLAGKNTQILPPDLLGVVFKPSGLGIVHAMGRGDIAHHLKVFVQKDPSGGIGPNVNACKILSHGVASYRPARIPATMSIKLLTLASSTRPVRQPSVLKAVPMQTASHSCSFSRTFS